MTLEYKNRYIIEYGKKDFKVFNKVTGKQVHVKKFASLQIAKLFIDQKRGI